MASGGREALKWLAVILMTGDHVAKVFYGGYVPVISELGRIAFPVFALVMAYNLAEPDADIAKYVLCRFDAPPAAVVGKLLAIGLLCLYNGNGWALLVLPVMLVGYAPVSVPRTRWAFYGYYVGYLALLTALAGFAG